MYNVTVSTRGQVVIPVEVRKKMNIKEGDLLSVQEEGGRIILKPLLKRSAPKGIVEKTAGLLSELEISGREYVETLRRGSGRRLDEFESGC
ncbi:MAG: AbrB/MazE/SpoVT family DNA-binding domain-containing protein [Desulfotomaculales bacterium]